MRCFFCYFFNIINICFILFSAQQRDSNQGLGAMTSSGPDINDNEYDAYRKRMMLAYRFRPNPLVRVRKAFFFTFRNVVFVPSIYRITQDERIIKKCTQIINIRHQIY